MVQLSLVEIEAAEQSPEGRLVDLKCPRCGWYDVAWRTVSEPTGHRTEKRRVSPERAAWWFEHIRNSLNLL